MISLVGFKNYFNFIIFSYIMWMFVCGISASECRDQEKPEILDLLGLEL